MNPRYEAWLQMMGQRDQVMVNLFVLAIMALAYYLVLVRGNPFWQRVALAAGEIAFYGSLLACFLVIR